MNKTLVLFDFDGTITSKDSLFDIARYSTSGVSYWIKIARLIPTFVFMKFSLMPKQKGKEIFLKIFFSNMKADAFNQLCNGYCKERLPDIIRPLALKKIMDYKKTE